MPSAATELKTQVSTHAQTTAVGRVCGAAAYSLGQATPAAGGVPTDRRCGGHGPRARRFGRLIPSNQSRAGCSHSIAAEAATTDDTKPPVTMPVRNRGTASTVSASRALRLRRSTW